MIRFDLERISPLILYKVLKIVGFMLIAIGIVIVGVSFQTSYYVSEYDGSEEINDYVSTSEQRSEEEELSSLSSSEKFSELSDSEKEEFKVLLNGDTITSSQLYNNGIYQVVYDGNMYIIGSRTTGSIGNIFMFIVGVLFTSVSVGLVVFAYYKSNQVRLQELRENPVEYVEAHSERYRAER